MKRIIIIARNELRTLFMSPVAWLALVVFMLLAGSAYLARLQAKVFSFEVGGNALRSVYELTQNIVGAEGLGYFNDLMDQLYLLFPLITMGLISREINNGTIRLLYSSPVRVTDVVFGKFLAMVCFTLGFIFLTGITLVGLSVSLAQPDYLQMAGALGGMFLVLITYASIGLFVSSLTSYQVVAAILTFVVLFFFSMVGGIWQDVDLIRHVTFYLDINGKSVNLLEGLYNLRDFIYFLLVTGAFLAFTTIRLRSAMQSVSIWIKGGRYLAVIAVVLAVGLVTEQPAVNVYTDLTRDQIHTITPPTREALARLDDGPLEITMYSNLLNGFIPSREENSTNRRIWEPYIRFKPDIKINNLVHYYDVDSSWAYYFQLYPDKTLREIAEKQVKTYNLTLDGILSPEEVAKLEDVESEAYRTFFRLTYKDKSTVLRTFSEIQWWPLENEIAAAINRLVGTPPRIAFVSGEIERSPFGDRNRDYTDITHRLWERYSLVNQGFDIETISLDTSAIPEDLAVLVIADPRTPFSQKKLKKIRRYIESGGNLLLTTEPDRKAVTQPILDMLGLSLRDGLLIQSSDNQAGDVIYPSLTDTARHLSPQFYELLRKEAIYTGDTRYSTRLPGVSALEFVEQDGFRIEPLLTINNTPSVWNRTAPIDPDSLQLKVPRLPGDEEGPFVTGVLMKRPVGDREQRIIVMSDADYLSNVQLSQLPLGIFNWPFSFWSFSQFTYGQYPANTLRVDTDDSLVVRRDDLGTQRVVLMYIIPGLITLLGLFILIRRRRK